MCRRIVLPLVLICLLLDHTPPAGAQVVTRADSAAILLDAAEAFRAEGRWEVAEALLHFISERYGDTPAGMEAQSALRLSPPEGKDRSTQVELVVWSTIFGSWLGVAVPAALGAEGSGAYGAGLLIGGPVGFLGGRGLSRSRPLSEGQVRAITFGSLWGTWQGWGVLELMDWGGGEECYEDVCYVNDPDGEDILKAMVVGGLAGVATGAFLARKPITRGVATTANLGALWGTWFGFAGGVLADLEDDQLLGSTLLVGNAGLIAAARLAPGWEISRSRARLISISGVIGLLGGLGLDLIFQPENEKVAIGLPLATSIAGLALGANLTGGPSGRRGPSGSTSPSLDSGMDRENGAPGPGASLLKIRGGRLTLGTPVPFPTLVPVDGPRGSSYRPALAFNLLSSRF